MIKQILLLLALVGLAVGGVVGYERLVAAKDGKTAADAGRGDRGGPQEVQVVLAKAERRHIERRIEAVGTTLAKRSVDIVPLTSGRIVALGFEPGDSVADRQVLARLDDDIERADLAEAQARLDEARLALERAHTLTKTNTVSKASLEQLTAGEATARAQLARAERRLGDRTVRAPFAGIVGLRRVDVGARVDDSTMITTLDDLSEVEIEFALPETVFAEVKPGMTAAADGAAFPGRTFDGSIATIDSRIDPVSRSFKVRALVPNRDRTLPAGMFMHLSVVLDSHDAIMIAEEAVVVEGKEAFVFVESEGKASRRPVALGAREVGAVEITDGIEAGERVVVRGVQRLRDGSPIREAGTPPTAGGPGRRDGGGRRGGGGPGGAVAAGGDTG